MESCTWSRRRRHVISVCPPTCSPLVPVARRRGLEFWSDGTGVYGPGDKNWRIPDISLSRPEHASARGLETAELVVEVLSPDDESRQKLPYYAKIGIREVWLIDPTTRVIEIYTLVTDTYELVAFVNGVAMSPCLGITLSVVAGPRLRLADIDGTISDV